MGSRQVQKSGRTADRRRQEVAFEAARILATEGQRNYLSAKEKAANRLGVPAHGGLPSNSEVEAELKRYQAFYGGDSHRTKVQELRAAALEAMSFFERFRPKLAGPVLEGTADAHSRVTLHLFCDSPDDVVQFLLRNRMPFEQETRRIRWHDASPRDLELVVIEGDGTVFELALMAGAAWRQPPPDPIDGRPQRRAGVSEVQRLIEHSPG